MCVSAVLPSSLVLSSSGPTHGLTQLGLRSYPSGSFVPETTTTLLSFIRPDRSVYTTALVRLLGPCQNTPAMAGPTFSYLRNPYPHMGWGAHMGDSQISGTWTRTDRKLHINCLELKAVVSALQHWAPLLQGHQVMIATDNSTVVSYINKQGVTRSPTLLRLTVKLLLWLEAQNIIVRARHIAERDSRPPILCESANTDRVKSPPRDCEPHLQVLGNTSSRHIHDCAELSPSLVHRRPSPIACTTISGFASLDEPQGKGLIRLIPQLLR